MTNRTTTLSPDIARERIFRLSQDLSMKDAREVEKFYKSIEQDSEDKAWKLEQLAQYAEDKARSYRCM